jgi:threonine dehydrogenase-like Zn-dependent dehydrogenase
VVIRNEASLVSAGTELAVLHNQEFNVTYPVRSGYASVGRLLAAGEAVKDFKIGDRVFYAGKHARIQRFLHGQDHQWGRLYPVPEGISSIDAVFVCLAEIAMVAPILSAPDPADTVAVFGLGVIGNLSAQIFKTMGCRVIGLDPVVQRCKLAEKVGIDTVLSVPADQQVAAVKKLTNGAGASITVDAAGHSAVIRTCVPATALLGQVVLLGAPRLSFNGDLTEVFHDVFERGITVRGGHMWQLPAFDLRGAKKTVAWAYRSLFGWIQSGKIQVSPLRSHTARITDAPEIYNGLKENKEKYWGVVFEYEA